MPRPPLPSNIICCHCGSTETCKAGFNRGKQRYHCRACHRKSRENPRLPGDKRRSPSKPELLPPQSHMILELLAIAQKIGNTPAAKDIEGLSKYSVKSYYQAFSNLSEAFKKAGLKPRYNQILDKDKLLEEIRILRAELKRPLLAKDIKRSRIKGKISPPDHYKRAFGSVSSAIKAAGAGIKKYTREEMIEIIRKIDSKLARPVLASDVDEWFRAGRGPSLQAIEREFGGLGKARRAANVKNVFRKGDHFTLAWQKYTPDMLIEQLKSLGGKLGRKPIDRDINRASNEGLCASAATFVRMFGSLNAAYREAGYKQLRLRSSAP
jgi:hypothetical protein